MMFFVYSEYERPISISVNGLIEQFINGFAQTLEFNEKTE